MMTAKVEPVLSDKAKKVEEMLEPKLVPINLWALTPADIFYSNKERYELHNSRSLYIRPVNNESKQDAS
jgi:hypothetical protein